MDGAALANLSRTFAHRAFASDFLTPTTRDRRWVAFDASGLSDVGAALGVGELSNLGQKVKHAALRDQPPEPPRPPAAQPPQLPPRMPPP